MFITPSERKQVSAFNHFLGGGGEMGALIRSKDWSSSSLGFPSDWPITLCITLNMMLNSRFPMFIWWGKDHIMLYNDAYLDIVGDKHPKSFGGLGAEIWAEVWDELGPVVDSILSDGISTWSEDHLFNIIRNGKIQETYFTYSHSPIRDEYGQICGILCICQETTEKVFGLKKLEESEKTLRNLVMQAPIGICIINKDDLSSEIFNNTFLEVVGKPREDFEQKPFWEVLSEAADFYAPILDNVFTTGITYYGKEHKVTLIRKGIEETFFVDFVYQPIKERDGTIKKIINIVIDITEKVKARIYVEDVNQQLKTSVAELKQFAYIASHDLQEPLRKVNTYITLLKKSLDNINDLSRSYLDKMESSSSRMLSLIKDVLAFSQLSNTHEAFKQVDLSKVIEEVITDFELLIEQKGAIIQYEPLPTIEAIPLQMAQLFNNLMSNSLKYMRMNIKPVIRVTSKKLSQAEVESFSIRQTDTAYYLIHFADNGISFNQENAEQIFKIFQRLHIKTEYSGTGIGLAMCKKVVENHHGIIYATAVNNEGAVFSMILPEKQ